MGLQFLAITDHSYDLDDKSNSYLVNDPNLEKWSLFQNEVKSIQNNYPKVILIPGEEISTGNHKNQNIHCLFLNDSEFFPGKGDSAENLWKNHPTLPLTEILQNKSKNALAIAAHPLETPPFAQRLILRRGIWGNKDLAHPTLDALQILNGENEDLLKKGLDLWSNLLLQGRHIGVVAGSDSHGNFNCFRQISVPFLKMAFSRNHLFGKVKTGVFLKKFTLEDLMQGIQNHQTLISNGPFATLEIRGEKLARIGDTIKKKSVTQLHILAISSGEFGPWLEIYLFWGNYKNGREIKKPLPVDKPAYNLQFNTELLDNFNYVRLEAYSRTEHRTYFCITSPIWIE
jgi:hypothetical protein